VADFGCARIVAKQQNLYIGMDALPTAEGVALNHIDVTVKGLRCCEQRKHKYFHPAWRYDLKIISRTDRMRQFSTAV
jgi:hypothetical protein